MKAEEFMPILATTPVRIEEPLIISDRMLVQTSHDKPAHRNTTMLSRWRAGSWHGYDPYVRTLSAGNSSRENSDLLLKKNEIGSIRDAPVNIGSGLQLT
jgi:hypothetical protein